MIRFLSIALPNDSEAFINPETVEMIRYPTSDEHPAKAVLQFTSGLTLRVRDQPVSVLNRILAALESR